MLAVLKYAGKENIIRVTMSSNIPVIDGSSF